MLLLPDRAIRAAVDAGAVVNSQQEAYRLAAADGELRSGQFAYTGGSDDSLVFAHSAVAPGRTGAAFKTGTQFPGNHHKGLPAVHASVTLHDPATGSLVALLDGSTVTTLRTSGGLVAAARELGGPTLGPVAVFGSGAQAIESLRLLHEVDPHCSLLVHSSRTESRERLRSDPRLAGIPFELTGSAEDACRSATVLMTCTRGDRPIIRGRWIRDGATILTMGSYEPHLREIDLDCTAAAARTFVDAVQSTDGVGPIVEGLAAGVLSQQSVRPLGEVITGATVGRSDAAEVLVFHSKGLGVQDLLLSWRAYNEARRRNIGTHASF